MIRIWSRINNWLFKRSKAVIGLIAFTLVVFAGYLEYRTGPEISLSILYLAPIALTTWYIDTRLGSLVTLISITTSLITNQAAGEIYSVEGIRYWNAFTQLLVFGTIILLMEEFKHALSHERMHSQTDFLTGIANSQEFYLQAEAELQRANRSQRQISIAYIDLDGFKRINDEFGHRDGDMFLRAVAQAMQSALRKTDLIARLGGDEFVILLPNTDLDGAKCIMERVHQIFQEKIEPLDARVTLSAGVVSFPTRPSSVDEMLHKSDQLMCNAKSGGRNKIFFIQSD